MVVAAFVLGNLSVLEVIWFVVGAVASYFSWSNLHGALGDKAAMQSDQARARFSGTQRAEIEAHINSTILEETIRLTKGVAIVITAIISGLFIPPIRPATPITVGGIVVTMLIVYIGFAIALASYLAASRRQRVVAVRREASGKASADQT